MMLRLIIWSYRLVVASLFKRLGLKVRLNI